MLMPSTIWNARGGPTPQMERAGRWSRLSRGRSTPAIRAMWVRFLSALPLLVARVRADHHDAAAAPDHPAPVADPLDAWTDLHCVSLGSLLEAVDHAAPGEVVRRQLQLDAVPRQDPDVVHPHLAGDMCEHGVPVLEFDPEHGVGKGLDDRPLYLDHIIFGHATGFSRWICSRARTHATTRLRTGERTV